MRKETKVKKIDGCTDLALPSSKRNNSVGKCIFYFCDLFDATLTSPHYMAAKDRMNHELEGAWKEAVVTHLSVPSQHLLGETEETTETPQNSRCPRRDANKALLDYSSEALYTERSQRAVTQRDKFTLFVS
jgi:hypothetical protein